MENRDPEPQVKYVFQTCLSISLQFLFLFRRVYGGILYSIKGEDSPLAATKNAGAAKKTQKKPAGTGKTTKNTTAKAAPKKQQTKKTSKTKEPVEVPRATLSEAFGSDVLGLMFIALGVLFGLFLYGAMPEKGLGKWIYWVCFNAVGFVSYALPPFCLILGVLTVAGSRRTPARGRVSACIMLILFTAAFIHLMGGISYKEPTAGANAARTLENAANAVWDYIKNCSERSLGLVKNATRGGGVLGGFICLVFYIIGGQGLCAVGVVAGLLIAIVLVTRVSLKTFPDYLKGSISGLFEKLDPEDDGTEDDTYIPFSGKKRKFYVETLEDSQPAEESAQEDDGEEAPDIELGHLSAVNADIAPVRVRQIKRGRIEEDTGSDEYDGLFNNEPIDDTLPMEPELRVTDMKEEARKRAAEKAAAAEPAFFGASERSFLTADKEPEVPEALLFGDEPEPAKAPVQKREQSGLRSVMPGNTVPSPAEEPELMQTGEQPAFRSVMPAEAKLPVFTAEPPQAPAESLAEPLTEQPPEISGELPEESSEMPPLTQYTAEERKEAFAARPYTEAEAAAEAAPKPAPKFRPVDEVTGEPLPEAQEAPEVYEPFSLDCLNDPPKSYARASDDPEQAGQLLVETLKNFGIESKLLEYSVGPVVTRYELQPAPGVRVSKITSLANDLALALAATRVRIEAPIPNKAAVGIEVPNKKAASVFLKEIVSSDTFTNMKSPVAMAMGKDIGGKIVVADLAKMPHMLIAGSTGSGKSVCINNLILSMVYKSAPADLRLILVDPKQVELSVYGHLPHLLIPVVTDPKKASSALRWAVNEMTLRYSKFTQRGARDLNRYNSLQTEEKEKLPRIVVIIDELADLMMVCPDEVEDSICRIAQLGRAAGLHLIVATQRPSSDVITGLIKANIPSRAAFAVSSAIDSRIILDSVGAEKLLGKGDCLFHPNGADKPTRLQAAFVSDEEVEQVMEHYKNDKGPNFDAEIQNMMDNNAAGGAKGGVFGEGKQEDDLLGEAVRIVLDSGQASISMIQRKLRVGYARAARLVDMMEEKGYVSGFDGSKPRKVLIKRAEFEQLFGDGSYVPPEEEPGTNYEDGYVPEEYRI